MTTTKERLHTIIREHASRERGVTDTPSPAPVRKNRGAAPVLHGLTGGLGYDVGVGTRKLVSQLGLETGIPGVIHWDLDNAVAASAGEYRLSRDEMLTLAPVDVKSALVKPGDPLTAALMRRFPTKVLENTPTLTYGEGGLQHPAAVVAAALSGSRNIHDLLTRAVRRAFSGAAEQKVFSTWISTAGTVSRFTMYEALALQARLEREHQPRLRKYLTLLLNDTYVADKPANTLRARAVTLTATLELEQALRGIQRLDDLITKGIAPQQVVLPDVVFCLEAPRSMPRETFVGLSAGLAMDMGQPFFEEAINFLLNGSKSGERQALSMIVPGRAQITWTPALAAELLKRVYAHELARSPNLDAGRASEARGEIANRLHQRFGRSPMEWMHSSSGPAVFSIAANVFNTTCRETLRGSLGTAPRRLLEAVDKAMDRAAKLLVEEVYTRVGDHLDRGLDPESRRLEQLAKDGDLAGTSGSADAVLDFLKRFEQGAADALKSLEEEQEALLADREALRDQITPAGRTQVPSASPPETLKRLWEKWVLRTPVTEAVETPPSSPSLLDEYVQFGQKILETHAQVEALRELIVLLGERRAPFQDEIRRVERYLRACAEASGVLAGELAETEASLETGRPAAPGIYLPDDEEISSALLQHYAPERTVQADRQAVIQHVARYRDGDDSMPGRLASECRKRADQRFSAVGTLSINTLFEILPPSLVTGLGERLAALAAPCAELNEVHIDGGEIRFLACPQGANSSAARRLLDTQTLRDPVVLVSPYASQACEAVIYYVFTEGIGVDALARTPERLEALQKCEAGVLWADQRLMRNPYRTGAEWDDLLVRAMAAKAVFYTGWRKPAPQGKAYYLVPDEIWEAFDPRKDHARGERLGTSLEKLRGFLDANPQVAADLEARIGAFEDAHGNGALRKAVEAMLAGNCFWYPGTGLKAAAQAWLDR
jgi:hypothetical protein